MRAPNQTVYIPKRWNRWMMGRNVEKQILNTSWRTNPKMGKSGMYFTVAQV